MYNWRKNTDTNVLPVSYYHDFNNLADAYHFATMLQRTDVCGSTINECGKGYRVNFTPPQCLLSDYRYEGDGIQLAIDLPSKLTPQQAENMHSWFVRVGLSSEINYMLPANGETHDCTIWIDNGDHGNDFSVTAYTLTEHD